MRAVLPPFSSNEDGSCRILVQSGRDSVPFYGQVGQMTSPILYLPQRVLDLQFQGFWVHSQNLADGVLDFLRVILLTLSLLSQWFGSPEFLEFFRFQENSESFPHRGIIVDLA